MTTSESIKTIGAALVGFHKEVDKISKDAKNPFFKSKFASLSNILDAIKEPLINNGLAIVQFPEGEHGLTTRIIHISGEWMESNYSMRPVKDTPQDRGSAITYQRRYAIGAILSLNISEDDDANAASGKTNPPRQEPVKMEPRKDVPTKGEKEDLIALLNNSTLDGEGRAKAFQAITDCKDYDQYQKIQHRLEGAQKGLNQVQNPSQKQINQHLKSVQT